MIPIRTLVAALLLAGCLPGRSAAPAPAPRPADAPPPVLREFRGVWVAAVSNIDWPSRPGLPVPEQQAELLAILDRAAEMRLNAVILHVRPAADALYRSELEPWSEYLTGETGKAPDPFWDPLEFAVAEAHRRGLELHAWFNPYRARHPSARSSIPESHVARARPDLVRVYGRHLWLDPGEPEVMDHTVRVVLDVVRRYDVDGVHIDDYFYPYKERDLNGTLLDFPDSASYERYRRGGGTLERNDWRRDNVDRFVERLYREIKREKPWVRFGVSPIGTWRPGHPAGVGGFDAYDQLYADARRWIREGWMDYLVPQVYYLMARRDLPYAVMLDWWTEQNPRGRHVWAGLIPDNVRDPGRGGWPASEIVGQVFVARAHPEVSGHVHFSMRSLLGVGRDSLVAKLSAGAYAPYAEPALAPASPWLDASAPGRPAARLEGSTLRLTPARPGEAWLWVVRLRRGERWETRIVPGWRDAVEIGDPAPDGVRVSAVGRTGNEGEAVTVR